MSKQRSHLEAQSSITCLFQEIPSSLVAAKSPTASGPYSALQRYCVKYLMDSWPCNLGCFKCLVVSTTHGGLIVLYLLFMLGRNIEMGALLDSPWVLTWLRCRSKMIQPPSITTTTIFHHQHHRHPTTKQPSYQACPNRRMPLPANHLSFFWLLFTSENLNHASIVSYSNGFAYFNYKAYKSKGKTSKNCCWGAAQMRKLQNRVPIIVYLANNNPK